MSLRAVIGRKISESGGADPLIHVPPGAPEKTTNRPRQGGDPFLI
jgi:hypothetical protein